VKTALSLAVLLVALPVQGSTEEASRYVKAFEHTYRQATTLRATFLEQYSDQGRLVRSEAGVAYFRRPGKMRWEYESPEKNLFLVDGKTAWFYVPADHTVTRMPAKQSADWRTPLALLAGEVKVSRICERVEIDRKAQPADSRTVVLSCILKGTEKHHAGSAEEALSGGSASDLVQLELSRASGELHRVVIHDRGGVEVEFHFANWEFNPPVDEKKFRFEPPMGVAIVNGELGSSAENRGRQ